MIRARLPRSPEEQFVAFSEALTGFDAAELWGTGLVATYYQLLPTIIGDDLFGGLMTRWMYTDERGNGDPPLLEQLIREQIFEDPDYGPVAQSLTALWYTGQWNQLPADWRNRNGASANDTTCIVSPAAYVNGLVWKALGTHAPAAQQPGYGSWALPPVPGARHD